MKGNVEVRKYDAARGGGFCITSKKIVAVALTAAMCLGLSMTAFAAKPDTWTNDDLWSPDKLREQGPNAKYTNPAFGEPVLDKDGNPVYYTYTEFDPATGKWVEVKEIVYSNSRVSIARNAKGQEVDITWRALSDKTLKSIDGEEKVAEIFKKNGYNVPDDTDFIPILNGNINFTNGVPEGGGQVTFKLADLGVGSEGVQAGDTVYVMQETAPGSGVWEVYAAEVGPNLDATVTLPRNGALVLLKTLSDGTVITLDRTTGEVVDRKPADNVANNNAQGTTGTSTNPSGATSPKTGEF